MSAKADDTSARNVIQAEDEPVGAPKSASLFRSSAVMAAGTLISRALGFLRWALLLIAIGGVGANDAFQAANTLPNMVFNLLAAGLLDAILVPQIVRAFKTRSGSVYVNRLLTLAGLILFGLTILMMLSANLLVAISAAQMAPAWKSLAVIFAWWCLPQIFFYGLYALLGEFLNARGIFGPYMWTPVANNVIGIAGILLYIAVYGTATDLSDPSLWDFQRTAIVAVPSTLGVVVQALLLFIPLRRAGVRLRLDFHFRGTGLRSASTVTGWVFATLVVGQIGTLSTSNIASAANQWWQTTGEFAPSNAALSYTFMVYMLPQSIISVSIATVIFTRMASAAADNNKQAMVEQYQNGVRTTLLLAMWLTAILAAGAIPVFQALGPNNPIEHMQGYANVLLVTLPGMLGACVILFSQRVFYAMEDARPVFYTVLGPTIMQVILGWTLKMFLPAPMWLLGAVGAETVSRIAQGVISIYFVGRYLPQFQPRSMIVQMIRYAVFATFAAAVGFFALTLVGHAHYGNSAAENFMGASVRGFFVFTVVTIVYFLVVAFFDRTTSARVVALLAAKIPQLRRFVPAAATSSDAPTPATGHSQAQAQTGSTAVRGRPLSASVAQSRILADLKQSATQANHLNPLSEIHPHWHQGPTVSFDDLLFGRQRSTKNTPSDVEDE